MAFMLPAAAVAGTAAGGTAAFGGMTAGASILGGTIGAAAVPSVGAGIGLGTVGGAGLLGGLAGVGSIMSIASPLMLIAGSLIQGQQQADTSSANAAILEYNRQVAEQDAIAALEAGEYEKQQLERQRRLLLGAQKAAFSSSGFTLSGTPLAIMSDTLAQFELDKLIVGQNAATMVNRYRSQASIYGYSAANQRSTSSTALRSSLLTGISNAATFYMGSKLFGGNA